jgi:WXG100 family type VII secretion target
MATYALNPNGLLDSGMELRAVTASIEASLAELNGYVNRFIAANVGNAASAYQAAQNTWNQGLEQMRVSLNSGATAIDNIRENYGIADNRGAALFQGNV